MTNSGFILHAEHDNKHFLRLIGEIRYPLAPSLDNFLKILFNSKSPQAFLVDLSATEMIDSTNLGLLFKIARFMTERHAPRALLFSPREDITEILVSMGFDQFFNLITDHTFSSELNNCQPIPVADSNQADITRTILEAHRTLIEMDNRNEAAFIDVVRYLEKEINHS